MTRQVTTVAGPSLLRLHFENNARDIAPNGLTLVFFTAELRAKKRELWLANVAVLLREDEIITLSGNMQETVKSRPLCHVPCHGSAVLTQP